MNNNLREEITVSDSGRAYLHMESGMIDGRYKIVTDIPLGNNPNVIKQILRRELKGK